MTLIDSRPGIHACYQALSARTGTYIDADLAITRLGPPLVDELVNWFPADQVQAVADVYREMYPAHAIAATPAMTGAREAIAAVRAAGGRAIVVTAKYEPNAKLHLEPSRHRARRRHRRPVGRTQGGSPPRVRRDRLRGRPHRRRTRSPHRERPVRRGGDRPVRRERTPRGGRGRGAQGPVGVSGLAQQPPRPVGVRGTARPATTYPQSPGNPRLTNPRAPADAPRRSTGTPPLPQSGTRPPSTCSTRTCTWERASVPRRNGATVTSVATAPTKNTMAPARISPSPVAAEFGWVLSRTRPG